MGRSLEQGDFVEIAFQTQSGPVHGMAEMLTPMRAPSEGIMQPFRFIALGDDAWRVHHSGTRLNDAERPRLSKDLGIPD